MLAHPTAGSLPFGVSIRAGFCFNSYVRDTVPTLGLRILLGLFPAAKQVDVVVDVDCVSTRHCSHLLSCQFARLASRGGTWKERPIVGALFKYQFTLGNFYCLKNSYISSLPTLLFKIKAFPPTSLFCLKSNFLSSNRKHHFYAENFLVPYTLYFSIFYFSQLSSFLKLVPKLLKKHKQYKNIY